MNWSLELKKGDPVIVDLGRSMHNCPLREYKIDKVTPTQFVIGNWRFRRSDGVMIGEPGMKIIERTQERLDIIERHELVGYIVNNPKRLFMCKNKTLRTLVKLMKVKHVT